MAAEFRPLVYADTCVFLEVLLNEEHADICTKVLNAAERGAIRLAASRLLLVELAGWGGNRPGKQSAATMVGQFLDARDTLWVEVDLVTANDATDLAWEHRLRAADAIHLATAARVNADYFMSYDQRFPYGVKVGQTEVLKPEIVWTPTLEDTASA